MGFATDMQLGAIQNAITSQWEAIQNLQLTLTRMEYMLQILVNKGPGSEGMNLKLDVNLGNDNDNDTVQRTQSVCERQDS